MSGAAVALQLRDDDQLQIFSFDRFDDHKAFTLRMPLRALAEHDTATLAREFADPARQWAGHLAGCLHVLHAERLIDLTTSPNGMSLAVTQHGAAGLGARRVSGNASRDDAESARSLRHPRSSRNDADRAAVRPRRSRPHRRNRAVSRRVLQVAAASPTRFSAHGLPAARPATAAAIARWRDALRHRQRCSGDQSPAVRRHSLCRDHRPRDHPAADA